MVPDRRGAFVWKVAGAAGIATLIIDGLYLNFVLFEQGTPVFMPWRVAFIATWIGLAGLPTFSVSWT
jgi:hypothetical protein